MLKIIKLFQYIICVGSILYKFLNICFLQVSIHHMCRFNSCAVSKIRCFCLFQYIICVGSIELALPSSVVINVSIHHMCRFNSTHVLPFLLLLCFNTSYVSVQFMQFFTSDIIFWFQYIICVGSIVSQKSSKSLLSVSIHHMCRFNARTQLVVTYPFLFQYIICVGSMLC